MNSKEVNVKYPVTTAKILMVSAIKYLISECEKYEVCIDGEYDEITRKVRTDNINREKYTLLGTSNALKLILGEDIDIKILTATNYWSVTDIDISALNDVIFEVEKIKSVK